jgi:hypothetical protein
MRKTVSLVLIVIMSLAVVPATVIAQPGGTVAGVARGNHLQSLTSVRVQLRNIDTGSIVGTTTTIDGGAFSFPGLPPGSYVAEVVDAGGKVLGIGAPVTVQSGATASTSVIALSIGSGSSAGSSSGFSFLGMGPVTTMTVLGAAAAASVTAVVATRPDASPSR